MEYRYSLILRILILALLPLGILYLSLVLTPLTIYPVFFLFELLSYNIHLINNLITINQIPIVFVEACIALSAYILLFILVFATKGINLLKRFKIFFIGSLIILIGNILRIIFLIIIILKFGFNLFTNIHIILWLLVGSLYVFFIWILLTKIFAIKNIPVYSDINYLTNNIFRKKDLNK